MGGKNQPLIAALISLTVACPAPTLLTQIYKSNNDCLDFVKYKLNGNYFQIFQFGFSREHLILPPANIL